MSKVTRPNASRRGTAVVELALCLPVLAVLMLATMEACSMMYLRQKLKLTAFEGARIGVVPNAKLDNVQHQCRILLEANRVESYAVSLSPADPETLKKGDYFTVTVSAPFSDNSLAGGWLYTGKTLSRSVSLQAQ